MLVAKLVEHLTNNNDREGLKHALARHQEKIAEKKLLVEIWMHVFRKLFLAIEVPYHERHHHIFS